MRSHLSFQTLYLESTDTSKFSPFLYLFILLKGWFVKVPDVEHVAQSFVFFLCCVCILLFVFWSFLYLPLQCIFIFSTMVYLPSTEGCCLIKKGNIISFPPFVNVLFKFRILTGNIEMIWTKVATCSSTYKVLFRIFLVL